MSVIFFSAVPITQPNGVVATTLTAPLNGVPPFSVWRHDREPARGAMNITLTGSVPYIHYDVPRDEG